MSELDRKALDANFSVWKEARMPADDEGNAFELYAIGEVLKDHDLSDDDIDSGWIGGGDDGGVDGVYFFVDGTLIREEDDELSPKPQSAELVLIQAKRSGSFSEVVVNRMMDFARDLLEWDKPVDDLAHLSGQARESIALFRTVYDKIIGDVKRFRVSVYYVTGGEAKQNDKVDSRLNALTSYVVSKVSHAQVEPALWDCRRLLESVRTTPQQTFRLPTIQLFGTEDERGYVCLVAVKKLAEFLGDEMGNQRRSLLESNVRAYQGSVPVNKEIRQTLEVGDHLQDFWWFNNGVTMVADSCHFAGRTLVIDSPQIVNGLQTCHEIFEYVSKANPSQDKRAVLLRVVIPPDPETRSKIIKATNRQTSIWPVSLRAMDPLHFNIEDRLRLYDLYYERRKGEYRAEQKPRASIVSMRDLGKAVIAIALRRPDTARARPGTLLNRDAGYDEVFTESASPESYATCVRIDRKVQEYLKAETDLDTSGRADLRYYVGLMVTCRLCGKPEPSRNDIAALGEALSTSLTGDVLEECVREVKAIYGELGGTDRVSKGPDLAIRLKERIRDLWQFSQSSES